MRLDIFQEGPSDIIEDGWKCLQRGCRNENIYKTDIDWDKKAPVGTEKKGQIWETLRNYI